MAQEHCDQKTNLIYFPVYRRYTACNQLLIILPDYPHDLIVDSLAVRAIIAPCWPSPRERPDSPAPKEQPPRKLSG